MTDCLLVPHPIDATLCWCETCKRTLPLRLVHAHRNCIVQFRRRGPGTELKRLLAWFNVKTGGCGCEDRARIMDQRGPAWCERNIPMIVGWLGEAAQKQGRPFWPLAAKALVWLAIRRARRAALLAPDLRHSAS